MYSLGGALATLAAAHITKCNPEFKKPIIYTYASPRVGDSLFASHFKDLECYRIANSEDLVVSLPSSTGKLRGPEMKGEPIYFTDQRGFITTNHNMFYIYRQALPK